MQIFFKTNLYWAVFIVILKYNIYWFSNLIITMKKIFLSLLLCCILVSCSWENTQTKSITESIEQVSVTDFQKSIWENESIIIDLRTTPELQETWIIAWAQQIDFYDSNFKNNLDMLDKNASYLIYCRSGSRSWNTLELMKSLWFQNVKELEWWISNWIWQNKETSLFN